MVWRWWMVLLAAVALVAVLVYEDRAGDEAAQPLPTPTLGTPTPGVTSVLLGALPTPTQTAEEEKDMSSECTGDVARARAIRHKYEALFWRQPNVHGTGIGNIRDANGERTGRAGFIVHVTERVEQSTLPVEDRIPGCLEGVPVEIREGPMGELIPPARMEADEEEANGGP